MITFYDKVENPSILENTVERFKKRGIILPTLAQQQNPELIPTGIKERLEKIGLWELHPLNLFRITWKNEPIDAGGLYGGVNYFELPKELTGVEARICVLLGHWFPTGSHKVGAAYGCLVPRIITGLFDPTFHKAVWPSTGNYCRGGAFDSHLMDCPAIAILPEEMSQERFKWLVDAKAEVIKTPGSESNVKEIYDKCWELRETRKDVLIFNQFDEFGNAIWHYWVTGPALLEIFDKIKNKDSQIVFVSATGSAGTIAAGDYLRTKYPGVKIIASEALQCPTMLYNGYGSHRIEGIGDKHIPWILNTRNIDVVTAIDDTDCLRLFRLFNEPAGIDFIKQSGVKTNITRKLPLIGISGIANIISAIKTAKYYELSEDDVILTLATDSSFLYLSRLEEMNQKYGQYTQILAAGDWQRCLLGASIDHFKELTYPDKKTLHNLKYFTWIEQQGKKISDLNLLWNDRTIWQRIFNQKERWDELIHQFNEKTGLIAE